MARDTATSGGAVRKGLSAAHRSRWVIPRDGSFFADLQDCEKGFLRNLDTADRLHPFLARFLLFQQLAFTRNVAAVAFRQHVLRSAFTSRGR